MPTLVVLDDVELFRRRVVVALEQDPTVEVLAELSSADEALVVAGEARPDVVVVAVSLGGEPVVELVAALRRACPTSRVVLLSSDDDGDRSAAAALEPHVVGVVQRDRAVDDLPSVIMAG